MRSPGGAFEDGFVAELFGAEEEGAAFEFDFVAAEAAFGFLNRGGALAGFGCAALTLWWSLHPLMQLDVTGGGATGTGPLDLDAIGPRLVLGGLAISMGASAIAGEEQDGTMDVLATAPRSRARLHASKAAAYLTLLIGGSFVASASYWLAAQIVGSDISTLDLTAATVHLTTVLLVYGILAFAIGAATGNRATASGTATGLLIVSFLGAGLLPLIDGWEDVGKIFPWYYISGALPLVNGTDWAQIGVLSAVWVVMLVLGGIAFTRRDLRSGGLASSLADRLRANPRMAEYMDKVRGSGSTKSLAAKAISDKQAVALLAAYGLFVLTIIMGPMFNALAGSLGDVVASMPDAVLAMIGFADYSTPTGWYHGEVLSITGPAIFAIVAVGAGVALATEEKRRTIAVLLSAP